MPRNLSSLARPLAPVVALVVAVGVAWQAVGDDQEEDSGPHAELTRSVLAEVTTRGAARNPVLLPRDLPLGAEDVDGSGFSMLAHPITSERRREAGKVWMTSYSVDALPPEMGDRTGYTVYQEWLRAPRSRRTRCGSGPDVQRVVRVVGDDRLTICLGPAPTVGSRQYWTEVPFTADLSEVTWLRGVDP